MPQPQYIFVLIDVCTAIAGVASWLALFKNYLNIKSQTAADDMMDQLNFRVELEQKDDSDSISI